MQNAAQAYRQTQVGTTGQGEIVVMLFDGALRFLSQAREKIQAKDYAAKGVLISRALDIINELDSSLNMEAGGDLAKNLHQLYFLCTTRLLQANLKLDLEKLTSVADILSGLRDAFAQAAATPEARAACAQISARQAVKQAAVTPRPLLTPPPTSPSGMPLNTVAGLYGHTEERFSSEASAPSVPGVPPILVPPASGQPLTPRQAAEKARALHALQAARAAQNPGQTQTTPPAASVVPPAPRQTPPAAAETPSSMADLSSPASGFAGKRLALYGKIQQSR